jgi:hypothetical protein
MKVVVLKEFGHPENLSLGDLPIPSVESGTALIHAGDEPVSQRQLSVLPSTVWPVVRFEPCRHRRIVRCP